MLKYVKRNFHEKIFCSLIINKTKCSMFFNINFQMAFCVVDIDIIWNLNMSYDCVCVMSTIIFNCFMHIHEQLQVELRQTICGSGYQGFLVAMVL